ncbi:predicted protein [Lichtheimia corymbifera JMRC:FSU:9682]|uniref:Uncharacterized protein n=1 Tax=Lichtheimia corymbifera JMRC:FSU:9682 TaxID=1263082 RepID=A0A068RFZ8_9FUNG|nr:predicted protein [Lichtheimia corymbifera JMRC:FSU:9682]
MLHNDNLNGVRPDAAEMMDGRSMTPEIAHLHRDTRSQGVLRPAGQPCLNKNYMLYYEKLNGRCVMWREALKGGWEH